LRYTFPVAFIKGIIRFQIINVFVVLQAVPVQNAGMPVKIIWRAIDLFDNKDFPFFLHGQITAFKRQHRAFGDIFGKGDNPRIFQYNFRVFPRRGREKAIVVFYFQHPVHFLIKIGLADPAGINKFLYLAESFPNQRILRFHQNQVGPGFQRHRAGVGCTVTQRDAAHCHAVRGDNPVKTKSVT